MAETNINVIIIGANEALEPALLTFSTGNQTQKRAAAANSLNHALDRIAAERPGQVYDVEVQLRVLER